MYLNYAPLLLQRALQTLSQQELQPWGPQPSRYLFWLGLTRAQWHRVLPPHGPQPPQGLPKLSLPEQQGACPRCQQACQRTEHCCLVAQQPHVTWLLGPQPKDLPPLCLQHTPTALSLSLHLRPAAPPLPAAACWHCLKQDLLLAASAVSRLQVALEALESPTPARRSTPQASAAQRAAAGPCLSPPAWHQQRLVRAVRHHFQPTLRRCQGCPGSLSQLPEQLHSPAQLSGLRRQGPGQQPQWRRL